MGGVEGVWVQRAAGKSDCGEGGGGEVVSTVVVDVDVKGRVALLVVYKVLYEGLASGSVCASGGEAD